MLFGRIKRFCRREKIRWWDCVLALFGCMVLSFGLYHVHSVSGITEGGGLGLTLLLQHWFSVSPAFSSFLFNVASYGVGWRTMGKKFLFFSVVCCSGFSAFYFLFEQFDPLFPSLYQYPLIASVVGALFVGVGSGLCVRVGGAPNADDALSMALSRLTNIKIQWIYLFSDLLVLGLSATYIPWRRLLYSLLTVVLSGQIIGWIQRVQWSSYRMIRSAVVPFWKPLSRRAVRSKSFPKHSAGETGNTTEEQQKEAE